MQNVNNFCQIYEIFTNEGCSLLLHVGQRRVTILGSPDGESSDDSLVDLVSTESYSLQNCQNTAFNMNYFLGESLFLCEKETFYKTVFF